MNHGNRISLLILFAALLTTRAAAAERTPRTDRHGDPLPPGALARLGTIRFRHGDFIRSLVFSPDGKSIASLGEHERIHVWDAANGREQANLSGCFRALAFSRDGRTLAAASAKGSLDLWDQQGKKIRTPRGDPAGFVCAAFSADGKRLAAVIPGRVILIWDVDSGRELHRLAGHTDKVDSLCLSADGRTLAAGDSESRTIRVWDLAAEPKPRQRGKLLKNLTLLALSPDGKTLVAADEKNPLVLWDAINGKSIRTLKYDGYSISKAAFSADGQRLAASFPSKRAYVSEFVGVWEVASGKELRRFGPFGIFSVSQAAALSPDGQRLATGGWDCTVRLFDIANGKELQARDGTVGHTLALCFAADGKGLVTTGADGPVRFWDAATGRLLRTAALGDYTMARSLTCSPDGRTLALVLVKFGGIDSPDLTLWDSRTGQIIRTLEIAETSPVNRLSFSRAGKTLVLSGFPEGLREVDASNGKRLRSLPCRELKDKERIANLSALALSPDGTRVAAVPREFNDTDRVVHWWDLNNGQELSPLKVTGHDPG